MDKKNLEVLKSRLKAMDDAISTNAEIVSNRIWENQTSVKRKHDLDMLHETMIALRVVSNTLSLVIDELQRE